MVALLFSKTPMGGRDLAWKGHTLVLFSLTFHGGRLSPLTAHTAPRADRREKAGFSGYSALL